MNTGLPERLGKIILAILPTVFTIGGTVWAFQNDKYYVWVLVFISILFISCASSCMFYLEAKESKTREHKLKAQVSELEENERPSFQNLQQVFESYSISNTVKMLQYHIDLFSRMANLHRLTPEGLKVLAFHSHGDSLFATTKLKEETISILKVGDPFLLVHRRADDIETTVAEVLIHQPTDNKKKTAIFRIKVVYEQEQLDAIKNYADYSTKISGNDYSLKPSTSNLQITEEEYQQTARTISKIEAYLKNK